jgi:glutamate dehydrogenase
MEELERTGKLNRVLERLPGAEEIAARRAAGIGLTRPELAVLLAYAKITLAEQMLSSDMPEDPFLERELVAYFPSALRERFADEIRNHPLRREIIVTRVVNRMVNELGITFAHRVVNDTAADPANVARAYAVAQVVYDLDSFRRDVEALDNVVPSSVQIDLLLEGRRLAERVSRWLLNNRRMPIDIQASIDFFASGVAEVASELPARLVGVDADQWAERAKALVDAGVPESLAHRVAGMPALYSALSIIDVATVSARPLSEVAEVYFDLADRLHLARVRDLVVALPRDTRWDAMARSALRDDLYAAHAELTSDVLLTTDVNQPVNQRIGDWIEKNAVAVNRALTLLGETLGGDGADLATLSVAMREIRAMVRAASL